jgi:hypothetical protein
MKNTKKYSILGIFIAMICISVNSSLYAQNDSQNTKDSVNSLSNPENRKQKEISFVTLTYEVKINENTDEKIELYMRDEYPIISDKAIQEIIASKNITKKLINDTLGIVEIDAHYSVPAIYLEDHPLILWELNIPEFKSRIYQIYNDDTILIDVWLNVVGKPSTKTYTGYYQAFRLRNWPSWKDPESGDSVRPTPPGPNNPLGLFVVHYDENSLRYFHGTNKNYLLQNEYRALSHGCVRNDNANIAKMKDFIIKKVIKADDLSNWLGSKKSMIYEIKDPDKFPVRIIYKTFNIDSDEYGSYIEFFNDCYNYGKGAKFSKFDKEELLIFSTLENILNEYKKEILSSNIKDEKLIPIIENLISNRKVNTKYYFNDLMNSSNY